MYCNTKYVTSQLFLHGLYMKVDKGMNKRDSVNIYVVLIIK